MPPASPEPPGRRSLCSLSLALSASPKLKSSFRARSHHVVTAFPVPCKWFSVFYEQFQVLHKLFLVLFTFQTTSGHLQTVFQSFAHFQISTQLKSPSQTHPSPLQSFLSSAKVFQSSAEFPVLYEHLPGICKQFPGPQPSLQFSAKVVRTSSIFPGLSRQFPIIYKQFIIIYIHIQVRYKFSALFRQFQIIYK